MVLCIWLESFVWWGSKVSLNTAVFLGMEELSAALSYLLCPSCLLSVSFSLQAVLTCGLTFPHSWMSGQWCHTSCSQRPGQQSGDWEADQTEQSHRKSPPPPPLFIQSLNWQTNTAKPSPRLHKEGWACEPLILRMILSSRWFCLRDLSS